MYAREQDTHVARLAARAVVRRETRLLLETRRDPGSGEEVVIAAGEVDLATAPLFREAVMIPETTAVVVDLSRVTFFGVVGVRILLAAADRAGTRGQDLTVVTSAFVRRVLDVTGCAHLLR